MSDQCLPLVTFYMSVKNGLPYLHGSIESIKNQTYPNWEAVIVDDGSNDETLKLLQDVERQDPRFKVLATNGVGRGKALNMAIENSEGEYVANLDADDLSHPQRLEIQVDILRATGYRLLFSKINIIHDDEQLEWSRVSLPFHHHVNDVTLELMKRNPVSHISVMCRREDVLNVEGYSERRKSQLDYDLWFRMVKSGIRLYKTDYTLATKRIHTNQSFENKRRFNYLLSSVLLQNRIISELNGGMKYRAYPVARFIYGLCPQRIRVRRRS